MKQVHRKKSFVLFLGSLTLGLAIFAGSLQARAQIVVSGPENTGPTTGPTTALVASAPKQTGVWGVIRGKAAAVYSAPNFDGANLSTLAPKTRVVMSRSTYGDQGPQFYKIKFQKNGHATIGYVSDADIAPEKPGTLIAKASKTSEKPDTTLVTSPTAKKDPKLAQNPAAVPKKKKKRHREQKPMLFAHYVGITVGSTAFKENISGINAQENLIVYGIKMTGPDLLFKGPVTELNVLLHSGAPTYYNNYSGFKPTGFIIWTDALLLYPFFNRQNAMIYLEAGPLLVLSDFKVLNGGKNLDLFSLNGGLSTGLAGAVRFGSVALRLEAKYLFENKSYLSLLGTVQSEF